MRQILSIGSLFPLLATAALVLIAADARAEEGDGAEVAGVFAGTHWGDSKGQVRKLCPAAKRVKGEPDQLSCTTDMAGLPASATFVFVDDGLQRVQVEFTAYHAHKSAYIDDYRTVATALLERHGESDSEDAIWTDDLYRDFPEQWGMALAAGMLRLTSSWQVEHALVVHTIGGAHLDVLHVLQYVPPPTAPELVR